MPRKRANNEGSLTKLPSGSWRAQVSVDGKRIGKTFKTQKEAKDWLRDTLNQVDKGLTADGAQLTVNEFLPSWLESKRGTIALNTYALYKDYMDRNLLPNLGKLRLADLTPGKIQALYNRLQKDDDHVRAVQITHAVLRSALEYAVKLGLLGRNPAQPVMLPRKKQREMTVWSESQVSQFLVSLKGHRRECLYRLALATGMRQGEILGLQWDDIDWKGHSLLVQRQATKFQGVGKFSPPKTTYGRRVIRIGANLIEALRAQIELVDTMRSFARARWQEYNLVFPSRDGTPYSGFHLSHEFNELVAAAGLPSIRFHDMRHTAASLMLNQGIPPIVVSRILGHSTPSITLNIYGHMIPGAQDNAAAYMDEVTTPVEVDL